MLENFEISRPDQNTMMVRLKNMKMYDPSMFDRMESDLNTLPCSLSDEKRGILVYTTKNLIPLSYFMEHYRFSQTEGYQFLIHVIGQAAAVFRTKPILLDLQTIFCSPCGDEIYFAAVPISLEYWMYQQDENRNFVLNLCEAFKTDDAYEIIGYLKMCLSADGFSMPALINGLKDLERNYYPRSIFSRHKPYPPFKAKKPVKWRSESVSDFTERRTASYESRRLRNADDEPAFTNRNDFQTGSGFLSDIVSSQIRNEAARGSTGPSKSRSFLEEYYAPKSSSKEADEAGFDDGSFSGFFDQPFEQQIPDEFGTRLLCTESQDCAWIDFGFSRFEINQPVIQVGRGEDNEIRLQFPDVSSHHARITEEKGRCYLQALPSKNGTWLDDHQVIRKMRLKEGMVVRFASRKGVFHEKPLPV